MTSRKEDRSNEDSSCENNYKYKGKRTLRLGERECETRSARHFKIIYLLYYFIIIIFLLFIISFVACWFIVKNKVHF